jgi:hypothetical protein
MLFPMDPMRRGFATVSIDVCAHEPCFLGMEILDANLTAVEPNELQLAARVRAWTADETGAPDKFGIAVENSFPPLNGTCEVEASSSADGMPVTARVFLNTDPNTGLAGVEVRDIQATSELNLDLHGSFVCDVTDLIVNIGFVQNMLRDMLNGVAAESVQEMLCTPCASDAQCPSLATCQEGVCTSGSNGQCAGPMLGLEGNYPLATLLSSLAPGATGSMDLLVAAGGLAEVNNGGLSLGMVAGVDPGQLHNCVPHDVEEPPMSPLPVLPIIREANSCPSCTPQEVHAIVALSESMLNRFAWAFHQGGALCLSLPSDTLPLSSGTIGLLMPSIKNFTWGVDSPIATELRPAAPPTFEVGEGTEEDPLLTLLMPQVTLDMYVWAHDRWSRLMSTTMDIEAKVNLALANGMVQPLISSLKMENLNISNMVFITEDPVLLSQALSGLVNSMVGPMLGDIEPMALPELAGLALAVPEGGITSRTQDEQEFLTIFAALAPAQARMGVGDARRTVDTSVTILDVETPGTEGFAITNGPPELPRVTVALDATGHQGQPVEFRTRLDNGLWTAWHSEREVVLADGVLLWQARHQLQAQARLAGQQGTADPTPAQLSFYIDTVAPSITVIHEGTQLVVEAYDMVSPSEEISLAWRTSPEQSWQPIINGSFLPPAGLDFVYVQAIDPASNVTVVQFSLNGSQAAPPTNADATEPAVDDGGCAVGTSKSGGRSTLFFLLVVGGWLLWHRRRHLALGATTLALTFALVGCSDTNTPQTPTEKTFSCDGSTDPNCCEGDGDCVHGRCCGSSHKCVNFTESADTCGPDLVCADIPALSDDCAFTACNECVKPPTVPLGFIGVHSSIAASRDGSAWIAGYAAGTTPRKPYGDLVVAHVTPDDSRVPDEAWITVDGVPKDGEIVGSASDWRGGIAEPGTDVGQYASVAVDRNGYPSIAYYDADHGRLKFVSKGAQGWHPTVVLDGETPELDAGRFADLLLLANGRPAVAYMAIERRADGNIITSARYIEAKDPIGVEWNQPVELDRFDSTPCTANDCANGAKCEALSQQCLMPTDDCEEGCESKQFCHEGACYDAVGPASLPEGTGIWPDLAAGPGQSLGVVFYNGTDGNLMSASYDGQEWEPATIVAGQNGDVGWAPSLVIDVEGTWHMTAVDFLKRDLLYLTSDGLREVVDGRSLGEHSDIRGDDSSIILLPDGRIRVTYQDSTNLTLWFAERNANGVWTSQPLAGQGLGDPVAQGFYVSQARMVNSSVVSGWYYDPRSEIINGVLLFWID